MNMMLWTKKIENGIKEIYLLNDCCLCKFALDSRNETVFRVVHSYTNVGPLR